MTPGLTDAERRELLAACSFHTVAKCPGCFRSLRLSDLTNDWLGEATPSCPECHADLTASLRAHVGSCSSIAVREQIAQADEVMRRSGEEMKRSGNITSHADLLLREAEAGRQRRKK